MSPGWCGHTGFVPSPLGRDCVRFRSEQGQVNGGPRVAGTLDAPECRLDRAVVGTFVCPKWVAVWTSSGRGDGVL